MAAKVIQVALALNDTFSKGLVGVAKQAREQGAEISKGMMQAARQADAFKKSIVNAVDTSITKLGKLATAAGTAAAAFSFKVGSEFEEQMAKVQAVASPTKEEFQKLTDLAKQMGRETQYSALEAAQALETMGRAGLNAREIADELPSLLNLTAADDGNLAEFADIMTNTMASLHMEATAANAKHFANVLAQTSRSSATNVSKMGESFENVAAIAGGLGYKLDDVSFGLGVLAKNGIDASEAGTQMRSLLASLAKPSKEASEYMNSLGIALGEAGKPKAFVQLLDELREKTSGLNELEKIQFSATLARRTGMTGLGSFINTDETKYQELKQKIIYEADIGTTEKGAAAEMAAIMNDTLNAKAKMLKNNIANVGIEFYNAFGGKAKSLVETLSNKLTELTENGTIKKWAESLGDAINKAAELASKAFDWIQKHADTLKIVLGGLAGAVGGIWIGDKVNGFLTSFKKVKENATNTLELLSQLSAVNGFTGLSGIFDKLAHPVQTGGNIFKNVLQNAASLPGKIAGFVGKIPGIFSNAFHGIIGFAKALPGQVVGFFKSIPGAAKGIFQSIGGFVKGIPGTLGGAFKSIVGMFAGLPGKIVGLVKGIPAAIGGLLTSPAAWGAALVVGLIAVGVAIYKNWDTIKAKAQELAAQFKTNFAPAIEAVKSLFSTIAAVFTTSVIPAFKNIWERAKETGGSLMEKLAPAGESILGLFGKLAELFVNNVVPVIASVISVVAQFAASFLQVAVPAIAAVIEKIVPFAAAFIGAAIPAIAGVIEIAGNLARKFLDFVSPAVSALKDIFMRLADYLIL